MAFAALTGKLNLEVDNFEDGVDDAEDSMDSLGDRADEVGSRMQRVGGAMTAGLTLPLAGMAAQSARTAASFEQNMQESISVMGDVDDAMREKLEETAQDVASSTTVSATEAAEAYYFLSSAGLDAAESMEAMPQVAEFAEAGQMDMAEATDVATNVMSAYGYEAEEMTEVTDRMTATVSNHNQTMEGMSDALSRVAPTASGTGVELAELNAAIGALGDQGIQGQRAGTALNTAISQMSDETSPARQELEELGVTVEDAQGEMLPLADIFGQLEEAGADAGDMAAVFGTQAGPAMAALLEDGGDALQENAENIDELDGATEDMAETQRESFNAQMQMARNEISNAGIAIGQELLPHLGVLVNTVSGAAEAFGNLSGRQQTAIVGIGALVAAIGPLLMVGGTLLTMLPAMATGYGLVAAGATGAAGVISGTLVPASIAGQGGLYGLAAAALAANVALGPITVPIWAIIAAVGALLTAVVGFTAAYRNNWMSVRDYTEWAISPILNGIDTFIESIFGISDATGSVADGFASFLDWIIDQVNRVPGVDIDGDGFVDFDMPSTEMDDDIADPDELSEKMDADDMLPDDIDDEIEDDVSEGAEAGMAKGIIDGLEEADVKSQIEDEIGEIESEIDEMTAGATSADEWEEVEPLEEQIDHLEEQRERLEEGADIQDIDQEVVESAAEAELEAEVEVMEWEAELAESLGEDVDMDFDRDEAIEDLDQQLQEDLDRELTTQEDKNETLREIYERLDKVIDAIYELGGPKELEGTLDLDGWEGDVENLIMQHKRTDARRNRAQN